MRFTVWGSRGSHPTALTPAAVQSKIATVIQRVRPVDLVSAESRERFLASLPAWLFGTTSGNTACVQLELDEDRQIVFDAGTGIINLGHHYLEHPLREVHIFFTHFHFDHIQGLPFFLSAYDPSVTIHFYSPRDDLETIVRNQMRDPYFPVTMAGAMTPHLIFHKLDARGIQLYGARLRWRELNHPGRAFGYRVDYRGKAFAYVTDVELTGEYFLQNQDNKEFFSGIDAMILDAQYTLDEAIEKINWGHSSFSLAVDFAKAWQTKTLYLFHHEPRYSDRKLEQNLQAARQYAAGLQGKDLTVFLAREGATVDV
ncbi:Phosphoribosyl 1,2-cyclic phosphodiesterase [Alkalispirochaeta americana]|uniref:Phosphoribosyl 1,2-cyclic phosphodiesterase n=1 Tax=Alkalispirochaeta americana TaxID=159291 RepID=A0A1N6P5M4_9SPIO|nr:MBL fold metallo-hydrolase [Alkalispirochaeta americana]SIP99566.1 Phosphoribosyl 1,2-cyclic phosphodiesterase [Alkalispirochaeta americana]